MLETLNEKRIFMVEDDPSNAAIIQMLLEQQYAKVFRGRWGGKETLGLLKKHEPIDLILMDLMLPNGITGYDVFHMIRQQEEFERIPIIAVSASDPSVALPKVRDTGFAGFIAKPIDFMKFGDQILSVLDGSDRWHINRNMEI